MKKRPTLLTCPIHNNSGMALLLTISVVAIMAVTAVFFSKMMWLEYSDSSTYARSNQLATIAKTGIDFGSAILIEDKLTNSSDNLFDSWATTKEDSFSGLFQQGILHLDVVDLSGLIQINSIVAHGHGEERARSEQIAKEIKQVLFRLLTSGKFKIDGEQQAIEIIDALIDWIDEDSQESAFGAESTYYLSMEEPYSCRDGQIENIGELLLIKGITPQLLHGTEDFFALKDFITIFGIEGQINMATAPSLLLQSIHKDMTTDLAQQLDSFRKDEDNKTLLISSDWYQNVPSWPGNIKLNEKAITSTSNYFKIVSTASNDDMERKITAVVNRQPDVFSIIYRRVE